MNDTAQVEQRIRDALRGVVDPEVGVNVVDLGLVYAVQPTPERVLIRMTMTTPACPMGAWLADQVRAAAQAAAEREVELELVWDPPWDPAMMSDAARRQLGD